MESQTPPSLARRLALRPKEAAAALGVSDRTLRKWMRDADLPYFRLDGAVRIPVADLRHWMAARTDSQNRSDELAEEILEEL
jgi:excisionase family DNA binding protein